MINVHVTLLIIKLKHIFHYIDLIFSCSNHVETNDHTFVLYYLFCKTMQHCFSMSSHQMSISTIELAHTHVLTYADEEMTYC